MSDLLIHPNTRSQLQALIKARPHAVLISGNAGTGKKTLAAKLIGEIISAKGELANNPYFLIISPENSSIGIESIRNIRGFLSRKSTGAGEIRRAILIQDAHVMTIEAQNALLKTLEEPPADTIVILTADDVTALKQTLRSRSQQLLVLPADEAAAISYFEDLGHNEPAVRTAYYMSDGRVGLLASLLDQSSEHELVAAINEAKSIIKMDPYNRLLQIESLSKQKQSTALLLAGLERVVLSGLRQAALKNNKITVKKFHKLSHQILTARELLNKSGNAKIVLTNLFMHM